MIPFEDSTQMIHGNTVRVFRFATPYHLLETLFSIEVRRNKRILHAVEAVIQDAAHGTTLHGNILVLHIGQQQTVVMDALAPDGVGDACVLPTADLFTLLNKWHGMDEKTFA